MHSSMAVLYIYIYRYIHIYKEYSETLKLITVESS